MTYTFTEEELKKEITEALESDEFKEFLGKILSIVFLVGVIAGIVIGFILERIIK